MSARTELAGVGLAGKTRQAARERRELLMQILWGFGSYIIAAGNMLDGLSPFGTAMAAACPIRFLMATAIGAVGGSLFPAGIAMSMKYCAAVLIASIARWSLLSGQMCRKMVWMAPVLAGLSLLLPSLAVTFAGDFTAYDVALSFSEGMIAAGAAYFFARTVCTLELGQRLMNLRKSDAACVILSLCVGMMSLSAFTFKGFSLGRAAACLVILLCAFSAGEGVGAVAGAACGAAVGLVQFPDVSAAGIYAVSGLISAVFAPSGKLCCWLAFSAVAGISAFMTHTPRDALVFLWEAALAGIIFMLLPRHLLEELKSSVFRRLERGENRGIRELLLSRLYDSSEALRDIAHTTQQVSQRINRMKAGSVEEIYNDTIDHVCRKCGMKSRCWQQEYGDSMNCFNHFTEVLRKNGTVSEEDFLYPLAPRCRRKAEIVQRINAAYPEFMAKEGMYRKVAQVRSVVTDQFDGMADMLDGFGREMVQISDYDEHTRRKILDYLESRSLEASSVNCYQDRDQLTFIQIYLPEYKLPRADRQLMAKELGHICDCDFDLPEETVCGERVRLTFREQAEYTMEFAVSQHTCTGSSHCGDSCSTFIDHNCTAHMIVSDGMGTGMGAAVDSAMTVSLVSRLLDASVDYQPALKIVNSALLVKSGEESLATVDIAAVDLYSGQADFYKAGAAPTFIRHRDKTGYVDSVSLPVGILTSVDYEKSTLKLQQGDIILMVSDGATAAGVDWIRHTLDRFDIRDGLQSLCDDVASTARLKRNDCHDDDITVAAGLLVKNG